MEETLTYLQARRALQLLRVPTAGVPLLEALRVDQRRTASARARRHHGALWRICFVVLLQTNLAVALAESAVVVIVVFGGARLR